MSIRHVCPRKVNVPAPMIFGLNAGQSFFLVGSGIFLGVLASLPDSMMWAIAGWVGAIFSIAVELVLMKTANWQRRASIKHTLGKIRSLYFGSAPRRFAGRGVSAVDGVRKKPE